MTCGQLCMINVETGRVESGHWKPPPIRTQTCHHLCRSPPTVGAAGVTPAINSATQQSFSYTVQCYPGAPCTAPASPSGLCPRPWCQGSLCLDPAPAFCVASSLRPPPSGLCPRENPRDVRSQPSLPSVSLTTSHRLGLTLGAESQRSTSSAAGKPRPGEWQDCCGQSEQVKDEDRSQPCWSLGQSTSLSCPVCCRRGSAMLMRTEDRHLSIPGAALPGTCHSVAVT